MVFRGMTEYEYNLTFTLKDQSKLPLADREGPNKVTIDHAMLEFMAKLVDFGILEMSFYASEKERIN
jgi:hypothetical protein